MDTEKLKALANTNPTAERILTAMALRERMRHTTDLRRFKTILVKQSGGINPEDYMSTFKSLQDMGLGSIIYGRRGKPDVFKWNYNLKDVGLAAVDGGTLKSKKTPTNRPKRSVGRPRKAKRVEALEGDFRLTMRKGGATLRLEFQSQEQIIQFIKGLE